MSRLALTFECQSLPLAGTLDTAPGSTGLLIVSGGNELRSGAFNGQADLAHRIARAGFPVFRFDRRGIGDSDGENRGFRKSKKDIAAAIEAFRAIAPQIDRVVAFGNCDAASALMLAEGRGTDGLILSNPWTIEQEGTTPPPSAIRSRYAAKLGNPKEMLRLFTGKVSFKKLAAGLAGSVRRNPPASSLASEMAAGIENFKGPVKYLLAMNDRTAQTFDAHWSGFEADIRRCEKAGHAYVEPHAREWLEREILETLRS